jgi:hypothetical protein
MSDRPTDSSRRNFLRGAAAAALGGAVGRLGRAEQPAKSGPSAHTSASSSRVVLVRHQQALDEHGKPNAEVLARMLDQAVTVLTGEEDARAAWASLIRPTDTVGIKSNVWHYLRTPEVLEQAIRDRVVGAGVAAERIAIDDRGVLRDPVFTAATALINVRPMRTHHWAGVGSLIKNYIMFTESPSDWHGDSCANLAGLWQLPMVKDKTRLNILVMLTPLFQSKGPHAFSRQYIWPYKGLVVSTDPVAADATGLRILQAQRLAHFGRQLPFTVSPKHIQVAEKKYRLGVADPDRIALIKLGWDEGSLI